MIEQYRNRTDKELEDMRINLRKGNSVALCLYSNTDTCDSYCDKFNGCWRIDYTSKLENKIKK